VDIVERERLSGLLDRLALGEVHLDPSHDPDFQYALERAFGLLQSRGENLTALRYETRLRLALHFAPAEALRYRHSNPTPRHQIIAEYLESEFERSREVALAVAKEVTRLLERWQEERVAVTGYLGALELRDGPRCQNCRVDLRNPAEAQSLLVTDPYKPFHEDVDEYFRPEVDHREAVSSFGRNRLDNLQILCRLCNLGKGRGLGLAIEREVRWSGVEVASIPLAHRGSMLYYVIARAGACCSDCGKADDELTVRPIRTDGCFARTNLKCTCYDCSAPVSATAQSAHIT
jgi:hypothetical protein